MRFRLLGPLTVIADDGSLLSITQHRQRALLSVMLLHPNQPMTRARLASLLWDQHAPGDGAVRTLIWALRRHLGLAARLHRTAAGYQLEVRGGELDLDEFRAVAESGQESLAAGDNAAAAGSLGRALRLWREPPLADLPPTTGVRWNVQLLLDERCAAAESLTDARLALGQHRDVLAGLRAQVALSPERERLWEQFMLALYRCGRRAEALAAFARVRALLAAEYGLDPGPGLKALHQQVLDDDPRLRLAHPGIAS